MFEIEFNIATRQLFAFYLVYANIANVDMYSIKIRILIESVQNLMK